MMLRTPSPISHIPPPISYFPYSNSNIPSPIPHFPYPILHVPSSLLNLPYPLLPYTSFLPHKEHERGHEDKRPEILITHTHYLCYADGWSLPPPSDPPIAGIIFSDDLVLHITFLYNKTFSNIFEEISKKVTKRTNNQQN